MTTQIKDLNEAHESAVVEYCDRIITDFNFWNKKINAVEEFLLNSGYLTQEVGEFTLNAEDAAAHFMSILGEEERASAEEILNNPPTHPLSRQDYDTLFFLTATYNAFLVASFTHAPEMVRDLVSLMEL